MAKIYELDQQIAACIQIDEDHVVNTDDGEILNLEEIPEEFKRTKVTVDADKTAIKKAIKAGTDVPGAEVIQKLNMTLK